MELKDKLSQLKGIGPKKTGYLKKIRIETIEDLLQYYPRDYEDRRLRKAIGALVEGETALVKGTLLRLSKPGMRFGRKQMLKLLVEDETGTMEVVFFQSGYLDKSLVKGEEYDFFGKVSVKGKQVTMTHPDFSRYEPDKPDEILPIYPLTAGLTQNELRKWQKGCLSALTEIEEYLPAETVRRNRICSIAYAWQNIHFPKDRQALKEAKYRLIFEELLLLQTGLLVMKNKTTSKLRGVQFSNAVRMESYTSTLPYKLTGAQRRVLSEINDDMESMTVMNRLVQGDVGSGKTAVAAAAIYKAIKSGYQAAFMAPTEILARQHFEGLKKEFTDHGINVGFLSGSLSAKEKKAVLEEILMGEIDVLIGTHAVIQDHVHFCQLGLVITDEQHRFGVNQRAQLSQKGESPDILVMTATPIPRTLAMILYGDLDISIIDEMPPGRQPVVTRVVGAEGREMSYEFVKREVQTGRQAYVVAPLIEDSDTLAIKSALGLYDELREKFANFSVAFLHGGMKPADKDRVMSEMAEGRIDILISTVVIEVGINIPNASVMLIENSERFGLAQLHQLRGRVGRGEEQSYCILVTDGKSTLAKERAEIMRSTSDGFVIAEKDLALRGPGEFFGLRQHGVPELKLADLGKHIKILAEVRKEADLILDEDEFLTGENNMRFREKIDGLFRYSDTLNL